jgi:hypothetical protein
LFLGCVVARRRWSAALVGVVAAVMLCGWSLRTERLLPERWLPEEESFRDYRPFASLIREQATSSEEVIFFRAEAHALAFRVGRPMAVVVEWPKLIERLDGVRYVVMPPGEIAEARRQLPGVTMERLGDTATLAGGRHERPLVLLRLRPAERMTRHAHD